MIDFDEQVRSDDAKNRHKESFFNEWVWTFDARDDWSILHIVDPKYGPSHGLIGTRPTGGWAIKDMHFASFETGVFEPVRLYAKPFPGKEDQAYWMQKIDHPVARLMESAPMLLRTLKAVDTFYSQKKKSASTPIYLPKIKKAIEIATGGAA